MVDGDDDDLRAFQAFASLRLHIVKVSSDFGARLAVRLMALAAASEHADPSVAEVFAKTMVDATNIMLGPLEELKSEEAPAANRDEQKPEGESDE